MTFFISSDLIRDLNSISVKKGGIDAPLERSILAISGKSKARVKSSGVIPLESEKSGSAPA